MDTVLVAAGARRRGWLLTSTSSNSFARSSAQTASPAPLPVRALLVLWGVGSLLQAAVLAAQEGLPIVYGLAASVPYYGLLAVLAVPLWWLCAWSVDRKWRRWRLVLLHALVAICAVALWQGVYNGALYVIVGAAPVREQFSEGGLWLLLQAFLTYALVVVGVLALQTSGRLRQQQTRSSELKLLAREMEVRALRAQLRPHFLFNVLNSIYSLIEDRTQAAQKMLDLLAQQLRASLDLSEEELIPLADELELIRGYLEIERIRLGDRLRVDWDLDTKAAGLLVPPFILQPAVENSIKHGAGARASRSRIAISTRAVDTDRVEIYVEDDGPGCDLGPLDGGPTVGKGLTITRNRLNVLYGDRARLETANLQPGGFRVRLVVPGLGEDQLDGRSA